MWKLISFNSQIFFELNILIKISTSFAIDFGYFMNISSSSKSEKWKFFNSSFWEGMGNNVMINALYFSWKSTLVWFSKIMRSVFFENSRFSIFVSLKTFFVFDFLQKITSEFLFGYSNLIKIVESTFFEIM